MIFTETKILVHFYNKFQDIIILFHDFSWLSMTLAVFHDFPGLENGLTKFHDFPWRVVTVRKAVPYIAKGSVLFFQNKPVFRMSPRLKIIRTSFFRPTLYIWSVYSQMQLWWQTQCSRMQSKCNFGHTQISDWTVLINWNQYQADEKTIQNILPKDCSV